MTEPNLKTGWTVAQLDDVAEIHDNLREPVNSSERSKRNGPYPYYGATGQVGWIDNFRQDGEYILLGEDGAPFFDPTKEKAYLVSGKCWVNNHAHVLKGREGLCLNRYILYALNHVNYRGYANGTTRLKLTQAAMRRLPIQLAPFDEQRRIVAKIEELFSELDKGIESLKSAQQQLKVYRQALLKHAFEGKLTAQWRADNADKLETADTLLKRIQKEREQRYHQQLADWEAAGKQGRIPKLPKALPPLTAEEQADLPCLPTGWRWEKNENYLFEVKDGTHDTPKYVTSGIPFVTQKNIRDGRLDMGDVSFISAEDHEAFDKRSNVRRGDLIISMIGHGRGQCCIVNSDAVFSIKNVGLFKFFHDFQSNKFLRFYYQSTVGLNLVLRKSKGGAQPFIGLTELRNWPVLVCSYDEQLKIVEELESKFSEVDQLDEIATSSLQQSEALRQSILKRAFSGQLVPQDPADEPAARLLERIRAEREKTGSKKSGRSR